MSDNIPSENEGQDAEEESSPTQALVPVDERQVDFYGDHVRAMLVEQAGQQTVYVPLRPICGNLGLDWPSQTRRIKRDSVLAAEVGVVMITTPTGGTQPTTCLPLDFLAGWLFGIDVSRVKPELREKMTRYRRECYRVLARAFEADVLEVVGGQPRSDTITELEQVRQIGIALTRMAEQQLEIERRQTTTEQRLNRAATYVQELNRRLTVVEKRTEPQQFVTAKQAGQISNQVKALAMHLTRRDNTKNHYAAIFGAIHHYFNVASIERLTRSQFDEVMAFMDEWREAADAAPPGHQLDLFSLDAPAAPQQTDEQDKHENL